MRPTCQRLIATGSDETYVAHCLYMPYIHWETASKLEEMAAFVDKSPEAREAEPEKDKHKLLLQFYLDRQNPLHNRRTFDQYCYYNLKDTKDRDNDQLLGRVLKLQSNDSKT
ncbi:hypothetical protein OQA88_5142 [Cercophora sp. LCS_1]